MVIILAVCLLGTKAVLEGMSDAFHAQVTFFVATKSR